MGRHITPLNGNAPIFARSLWLTAAAFLVLIIAFVAYVQAEKLIDRALEKRTELLLLAADFHQTSEQLTHLTHAYVTTGQLDYKLKYQEIIDIQDGNRPRPTSFYQLYGKLTAPEGALSAETLQSSKSFLLLALQLGVTKEEFAKLKEAKDKSDQLAAIEASAMELAETARGTFDANHLIAREMIFDKKYIDARDEIVLPLSDFYRMADQRTQEMVQTQTQIAAWAKIVLAGSGILLLFVLWRTYRALHAILGGPVDEVHSHIARIGQGDFSFNFRSAKPMRNNSVLAWLVETQKNLAQIDAARKETQTRNERLARLYRVLSESNEAITRCASESELFSQICRSIVTLGGVDMAWVGMLDKEDKRIRPVSFYGQRTAYVEELRISIDKNDVLGRGPVGVSFREDRPVWCQDFQQDPTIEPWRDRVKKFGWQASAVLPLHKSGTVTGVICIYSTEKNFFDEAVRNLFTNLAIDIDYALNSFESDRQRDQALEALADSRRMLRTIIDSTPIRIFWKDINLRFMGCNRAFVNDTKLSSPQEVIGKTDYQMAWSAYAERYAADDRHVLESGEPRLSYEEPYCDADGTERWLRSSKVPLHGEHGEKIGILGLYEDITEQKRAAEHIHYLANYDTLTGLPSRARLNDRMEYALKIAKRSKGSLTLMFLDLDYFKHINDALGHSVGDAVLIELAKRLRSVVREEDTIARFGGDEFVLLLPDTEVRGAALVAQKLLKAIGEPYRIDRYSLALSVSIGIAIYPRDGADIETLFKSADTAMYYAKKEGRRGFRFSTPAMQARSARNLQLVSAMNDALKYDQFEVYFQPQVCVQDGRLVGMEALLRWQHPEFGFISPGEFMPVAEETGLILPIGEKVLRKAVRQAKSRMQDGLGPLTAGVNLSVVQFRNPELPELISRILKEEGLPPELLDLELTESVAMADPESVIAMMQQLHERGVQISIDDFGTGYSSLSYLKKFRLHKLKIDQSFVRDITTDPEDKAIVGAIIQMARGLGLRTIAEGVETIEQMEYLREQGCDEMQGYYCSKPLPAEQFQLFIEECRAHSGCCLPAMTHPYPVSAD
jgi:diguanylate cyclase (GGDEF)-like protein/PAS domain S-box-containing protein